MFIVVAKGHLNSAMLLRLCHNWLLRRIMDPHARAFSFSRERARLNPIPDDLVISDSDPESIDNMDNLTTTKAAASQSHGRSQRIESSRIRGRGSIIELSDDSSRQPSIAGIIELSGQPFIFPAQVVFNYICFR